MTKRELIKLLKSNGFYQLKNRGKGSYEDWTNGTRQVIEPKPNGTDYPVGTANAVLKQAGLNKPYLLISVSSRKMNYDKRELYIYCTV